MTVTAQQTRHLGWPVTRSALCSGASKKTLIVASAAASLGVNITATRSVLMIGAFSFQPCECVFKGCLCNN